MAGLVVLVSSWFFVELLSAHCVRVELSGNGYSDRSVENSTRFSGGTLGKSVPPALGFM